MPEWSYVLQWFNKKILKLSIKFLKQLYLMTKVSVNHKENNPLAVNATIPLRPFTKLATQKTHVHRVNQQKKSSRTWVCKKICLLKTIEYSNCWLGLRRGRNQIRVNHRQQTSLVKESHEICHLRTIINYWTRSAKYRDSSVASRSNNWSARHWQITMFCDDRVQ